MMLIDPKHRFYLSLAGSLLRRPRLKIWLNYLKFRLSVGRVRGHGPDRLNFAPPSVTIWVTSRCNKVCQFCFYRGELNSGDAADLDMTFDRFLEMIDHPLVSRSLRICLYGGEPLLNEDLFRMVATAKKRGHLVTVSTNALLLARRMSEATATPPHVWSISYYPEDHPKVSGAILSVARETPVLLRFLLAQDSMDEVDKVLDFAARAGVRIVMLEHLRPTALSDRRPLPDDDGRIERLRAEMNKRYGKRILLSWPAVAQADREGRPASCCQFWNSLFVDVRGRISPCCDWPMSTYVEPILTGDSWNSHRMMSLRCDMRNGIYPDYCRKCVYLYDDFLRI